MKLLRARFIGLDGSLGYKKNLDYILVFKELGWIESFFKGHKIEIWRAEHIQGESVTGYCPYRSMTTFLLNWELYPTFELRFAPTSGIDVTNRFVN